MRSEFRRVPSAICISEKRPQQPLTRLWHENIQDGWCTHIVYLSTLFVYFSTKCAIMNRAQIFFICRVALFARRLPGGYAIGVG